jgi:hypothetical protein
MLAAMKPSIALPSRLDRRSAMIALGLVSGLVGGGALAGCSSGDDRCGPAVADGEVVVADTAGSAATLRFSQLRARPNNDCPAADAPAGVVSLTISGVAVGGTSPFTLCVARPDLLDGARTLGATGAQVELVDVVGSDGTCTYRQQRASQASGSVTATGVCDGGRDAAGFSLKFAGEVSVERTCGTAVDVLRMSITGEVPVTRSST